MIGRLTKWAERTFTEETVADDKISQGKLLGEKAIQKMQRSVEDAKEEVDAFGRAHFEKEQGAVQQAHHPVESLAQEAQSKLGIELTWLDGVTYADWQREPKDSDCVVWQRTLIRCPPGHRVPQAGV